MKSQMNSINDLCSWLLIGSLAALSGCAADPKTVSNICPPFPQLPETLLKEPPTLYLLPPEMRVR